MKEDDFTHKLLESELGKPTTDADKNAREILERMFDMAHERAPGTESFLVVFIVILTVFIAICVVLLVVWLW